MGAPPSLRCCWETRLLPRWIRSRHVRRRLELRARHRLYRVLLVVQADRREPHPARVTRRQIHFRSLARGRVAVKPSGGIRDRARAELFVEMGAKRLGNGYTSTVAICEGTGTSGAHY